MFPANFSRRGFLSRALGGMVAAGLPLWFAKERVANAQEAQGQTPPNATPNNQILIGSIGVGTNNLRRGNAPLNRNGERGVDDMKAAMRQRGVRVAAVCDVYDFNLNFAANIVGNTCLKYHDYRDLLENRDINAITIGTPDHWHAQIAIDAMRAGKDVYCEKPLTLTVEEAKAVMRVAQQTGKILQTGSQQRSEFGGRFRLATELVRNGRLGRISRIETRVGNNPTGGPFPAAPLPEGLNWEMWQGPTPRVDYVVQRCSYEFRWWYEYSGGKMTDWGAHMNDIAQWALDMDNSGPSAVSATSGQADRRPNSYNCHPDFRVTWTYNNGPNGTPGTVLECNTQANPEGVRFEGEDGKWLFVGRSVIRASDQSIINEPLPQNAWRAPRSDNHMGNFIESVRNRTQPICNPVVGAHSAIVCHIGNIALRIGRPLQWDPQQMVFVNDEDANRWLSRERNGNWRLNVS